MKSKKEKSLQKNDSFALKNVFPIIGIGASGGGLYAFKKLLKAIPENSGMAWILVQHLEPSHPSLLPALLQKVTPVPVIEITNNLSLAPNNIYIIPCNKMLVVKNDVLKLSLPPAKEKLLFNMPIDLFFTSLAQVYEANAIAVLLSGTASDGTKGLKAIKDHGGITIAQDEASAVYKGMPHSAIEAGVVDFILPPQKIPQKLLEITKAILNNGTENISLAEEAVFKEILLLMRMRKGMDFTYYKQTTIRRRIMRRMLLSKQNKPDVYFSFLRDNTAELDALYQDMLIPVTSFFRDSHIFNELCESVFPHLLQNKKVDEPIRIWVAGCSTGQEAYSMAMCFKEYLGHKQEKVQIFATDLSEPAIAKARAGLYSKTEIESLSPQRLNEFFSYTHGGYQVNKSLRDLCVFAVHNFLKDPPFSKVDFISCRNVLIYMDTYLQKKALATFHYALNNKGILLLGKSENTIGITDLFSPSVKYEKFFNRKEVPLRILPAIAKPAAYINNGENNTNRTQNKRTDYQKKADDIILSKYTPAAVLVNEEMDVIYFRGNTMVYLQHTQGKPNYNLLKMAKTGLAFELRSILSKVKTKKKSFKKDNIVFINNDEQRVISIEAIPIPKSIEPHYLILFHDNNNQPLNGDMLLAKSKIKKDTKDKRIQQLEDELAQLRQDINSITEEQESANEELQSTNEELLSSTEELQSLNEELETSKEEMQSSNEELTIVNQELINLNELVTAGRDYAEAIITTIPQPLLVLDKNLRIKIANKIFFKKFKVNEAETEGRLIYNLGNSQWDIPALRTLLEAILPEKESFFDYEVEHYFESIGHKVMLLNAREIKREDEEEKLILLSIEDITERKATLRNIEESEKQYRQLADSLPPLVWQTDAHGNQTFASARWKEFTGLDPLDANSFNLMVHPEDMEGIMKAWSNSLKTGTSYRYEVRLKSKTEKYHWFHVHGEPIINDAGDIEKWIGAFTDINERKLAEQKIKESEAEFSTLADNMENLAWTANADGWIYWYNKRWYDFTGTNLQEMQGCGWEKVQHPDHKNRVVDFVKDAWHKNEPFELTFPLRAADGNYKWFLTRAYPVTDNEGNIVRWIGTNTNIDEQKKAEDQFRILADQAPMWVWLTDKNVHILYANTELLQFVGLERYSQFTGVVWEQSVYPDDINLLYQQFADAALQQQPFAFECRIKNASTTSYEWFYIKGIPRKEGNDFAGFIGTAINMQEQKKALEMLSYRTALLETQNEASVEGILLVDAKGKIISYNKRFIEIWNMPKHITDAKDDEAALAYATSQLVKPDQFIEKVKYLYDHPTETSKDELEFKDGKIVERYGYPVIGQDGTYYAWSWTFRDITQQKMDEKIIKESEHRYSTMIHSSPSLIAILKGDDFVIETANNAIIEIWGKGKDVLGKPYLTLLPEFVEQGVEAMLKEVYTTGIAFNATEMLVTILRFGKMEERYFTFVFQPQRNVKNEVEGVAIIGTEVTNQAAYNKKIKESEQNFRQLSDLMPTKVSNADADGNFIYYNQSWLDYTGIGFEELKQAGWSKAMHPQEVEEITKRWQHALQTGEDFEMEIRLLNKQREYLWHISRATAVKDEHGKIIKWVGTNTEIQKIKEEEQRKEDFLKMVSHELKTPVTSIKGYVQLLLSMTEEENGISAVPLKASLERIDSQVLRLSRLITEMLDLSRIEAAKLELQKKLLSLNDLVAETVQDIDFTNTSHSITVRHNFTGNVYADKDRIGQVIINCINNAIKYSPGSNIVEVGIDTADNNCISVSVKDYGIGIDKADQQKIFERFYRAGGDTQEIYAGFGIGLFIANEIVQRHEGYIKVQSEPGKGSTFTFVLPLAQ